jgi:hypothetical protein
MVAKQLQLEKNMYMNTKQIQTTDYQTAAS